MSQQKTLSSYFKTCKRALPEQQAAKRRKVILQNHEIEQQLLDSDSDDESPSPSPSPISQEEPEKQPEGREEVEEAFADDDDWENLANKTLDELEEDVEIVTSVTTSACDDHSLPGSESEDLLPSDADTVILSQSSEEDPPSQEAKIDQDSLVKTPKSVASARVGVMRLSKTVERSTRTACWTPPSAPQPLFTIGTREQVVQAKKRLNWSEQKKQKNVVFTKVGTLTRKKISKCTRLNYNALNVKLTPKIHSIWDPEPAALSTVKTPTKKVPELTAALAEARQLEKRASPAQIKSKLGKAKLKDLRRLLSDIEGSKLKAESVRKTASVVQSPVKQPDIVLEIEVATPLATPPAPRTPVKAAVTPAKASPRKVPAYQRYHSLSQPVNRSLPLPLLYARLQEVFRSTDTIVSMMYNRQERITLDKLARHTTDLMNKKWEVKSLQQILCVFPQAYNLRWRTKLRAGEGLELVVEPNMNYKRDLSNLFDSEQQVARLMGGELLVERRDMFRNSLLDIVKDHHEQFLAALDPPIEADRSKLTKWHKHFEVDLLPDIDLADLPPNPQDILQAPQQKNPSIFSVNPRLGQILTDIDNGNGKLASDKSHQESPSKSVSSPMKARLEGVKPDLIARVKAKEAARAKLEMTRTPEELARISTLKKLPNLARVLRLTIKTTLGGINKKFF